MVPHVTSKVIATTLKWSSPVILGAIGWWSQFITAGGTLSDEQIKEQEENATQGEDKNKGDSETTTTNKGNEIDVTPSNNHTTTTENSTTGAPNSSVDILDKDGNIKTRRWFDKNGKAVRDVDYTNHRNPSTHLEWPHEHTWDWNRMPPRK